MGHGTRPAAPKPWEECGKPDRGGGGGVRGGRRGARIWPVTSGCSPSEDGGCLYRPRHLLVDAARARGAQERGGGAPFVAFDEQLAVSPARHPDLVALDEALTQLSGEDPRQGQVVELRYFGGLSVEETGEVLGVSPQTVMRDWKLAKLRLVRGLRHADEASAEATP